MTEARPRRCPGTPGPPPTPPRSAGPPGDGHQDRAGQAAGEKIPAVVGVNSTADVVPRAEAARHGHGTVGGWRVPGEPPTTAGHGIIGMRERAHWGGGTFSARSLAQGGFQAP